MSSITATADPTRARVRLDLDFSDIGAPYVYVYRVNEATGEQTAVRTHGNTTSLDGLAYQDIRAGFKGVLFDTECPRDTNVHYVATTPAGWELLANPLTLTHNEPWTAENGAHVEVGDFLPETTVTYNGIGMVLKGDGATASPSAVSEYVLAQPGQTLVAYAEGVDFSSIALEVGLRWYDASLTLLSSASIQRTPPDDFIALPLPPQVAPANTAFVRMYLRIVGTPATNILSWWSTATLTTANEATVQSATVNLASGGVWWLRDPLRPGNDIKITECFAAVPYGSGAVLCVPDQGVMFVGITQRTRPNNSSRFNVTGQPETITVSRPRGALQGTLTLVTRTNADEAALDALLAPGTPLLLQSPPEYNMPDLYLSIDQAGGNVLAPDQRIPLRAYQLPFAAELAPGGPASGVTDSRWEDQCNLTWAAAKSAGDTWLQLIQGVL